MTLYMQDHTTMIIVNKKLFRKHTDIMYVVYTTKIRNKDLL